jgi:hypothetical protein
MGFGFQAFDLPGSASSLNMLYTEGYGYGTSWDGGRVGGFGMSLISTTGDRAGGVGGLLIGHEWRDGPGVAALTLRGGVGGLGVDAAGYMILFGEADLELGLRITRWMAITGYIGYQAWGNLIPGPAFDLVTTYTPVVGIRLAWGSFN